MIFTSALAIAEGRGYVFGLVCVCLSVCVSIIRITRERLPRFARNSVKFCRVVRERTLIVLTSTGCSSPEKKNKQKKSYLAILLFPLLRLWLQEISIGLLTKSIAIPTFGCGNMIFFVNFFSLDWSNRSRPNQIASFLVPPYTPPPSFVQIRGFLLELS